MKYLLDTCVISELIKRSPDPNVINWIDAQDEQDLYLSVITLGEIQKGISKLDDTDRQIKIQYWLDDLVSRFAGRILELDIPIMIEWGDHLGKLNKTGINIPAIDSLLGASVAVNRLCLVTRNIDDFRHCGIDVFNPWKD